MPPQLPALPRAGTVLLLVDLIHPLQFDGAERLAGPAAKAAAAVAALERDAAARGVPDAFLRGFRPWVPADCAAAESTQRHQAALAWMARAFELECRVPRYAAQRGTRH